MRFSATLGTVLAALLLFAGTSAASVSPKLEAGNNHTCALQSDGVLKCFGDNFAGQLGDGSTTRSSAPVAVSLAPGEIVKDVAVGADHTCALLVGGSVKCWGGNFWGQLGVPDNYGTWTANPVPIAVDLGLGVTAVAIDAGETHTCFVLSDASVKCTGRNYASQLGVSSGPGGIDETSTPVTANIGPGAAPVSVATGGTHTCILLADGIVKCFGNDDDGQTGSTVDLPDGNPDAAAVDLGLGAVAVEVVAGSYNTCVRLNVGDVKCFGRNSYGELGIPANAGNTNPNPTPALVDLGFGVSVDGVEAHGKHTCAVTDTDDLICFGLNTYGQLGNSAGIGTNDANPTPTMVDLGADANVRSATVGGDHTCVLLTDGTVKCFGSNSEGQLSLDPPNSSANLTPNIVSGLTNMVPVATSVEITSHADGFNTTANSTNLTFTAAGTGEVSCTLNGNAATSPVAVSLFTGPNSFTVACTSETGAASATITINRGSPATVQITVPDGHKTTDSSFPIFYTTSGTSPVSCTLGGNPFSSGASFNLSLGANNVTVSCSNNFSSDSSTVTIYRGTVPSVAITSPADGLNTAASSAQIEFNVPGTAPVDCEIDGNTVTSPATVNLSPGANTIEVECTNDYGTDSDTIVVNQGTAPSVVITPPAGGTTSTTGSASIAFSSSGSGTVVCEYNGQPAVSPLSVTLTPGANLISIVCESEFGTTTQSFSINYVVQTPVAAKLGARIAKPRWKVKRANGKLKLSARVQVVGTGVNAASCVGTIRTSVKPTRANGKSAPGSGRAGKPHRSTLKFAGGKCVANVSLSLPAKYVRDAVRLSVINWLVGSKTLLAAPRSSRPKI